jgi:hypothetical protein
MRAIKRRMIRKEIKKAVREAGISMGTFKKWLKLHGRRVPLMKRLELITGGK